MKGARKMKILVVGASGATGQLLVEQLLGRGQTLTAIVRSPDTLPETMKSQENLSLINESILYLTSQRSRIGSACQWV